MKEHEQLKAIAGIYLEEVIDYRTLSKATSDYKELLLRLSEIDMVDEEGKKDIHFSNGKALGTTWAAMCLDDMVRTKRFIKGLFEAITDRLATKEQVHILYAGSGPFVALVLPLLTIFSPDELQCTILEINPVSIASAKKVITQLGFDEYIRLYENVDATHYKIKKDIPIDIILSETMQHALNKEQQVPIVINLLKQVNEEVILIPEKISLDLGLTKLLESGKNNMGPLTIFTTIGKVFELSKESLKKLDLQNNTSFPETTIPLSRDELKEYANLAILTTLSIYKNERLEFNESGLTVPFILYDSQRIENKHQAIKLQYKIDETPGVYHSLI